MKIITRSEAKALGLKRYFTGKPCNNGHVCERNTSDAKCNECATINEKNRAPRNSDEDRESRHQYREKNKETIAAKKREYYAKNRDAINERRKSKELENPETAREKRLAYQRANRESINARQRRNRANNLDRFKEMERRNASKNRDKKNAYFRDHYTRNRDSILDRKKRYYVEKPEVITANRVKRRARKMQAVPPWFDELDQFVWQEAADLVRIRREETGIDWASDHMIPLAGRKARGLHVAANCQVIPAVMNLFKNNKMILTERLEWLK